MLAQHWRLAIKPDSREVLLCAWVAGWQALDAVAARWPQWKVVASLGCLGVEVSNDGSVAGDLRSWRASVMTSVLRNSSSLCRKTLSEAQRRRHVNGFAVPLLDFRASRWPVTPATGKFIDAVQRKVILSVSDVPRRADEELDSWQRRRSRFAGDLARRWELWSSRHEWRALRWHDHLMRDHCHSIAAAALAWHGREWRRSRREAAGSTSRDAGRLGTRVLTHVHMRWDDSIATALAPPAASHRQ